MFGRTRPLQSTATMKSDSRWTALETTWQGPRTSTIKACADFCAWSKPNIRTSFCGSGTRSTQVRIDRHAVRARPGGAQSRRCLREHQRQDHAAGHQRCWQSQAPGRLPGVKAADLPMAFRERCQKYIPCELVSTAAWDEVVLEGDQIDLTRLPIPLQFTVDAAPYITAGQLTARDPVSASTPPVFTA